MQMKAFNTKLVLSALGIALLATPAFAQRQQRQQPHQAVTQVPTTTATNRTFAVYPNPQTHSGSAESFENGTEFTGGY
jgi:hypothetical protein